MAANVLREATVGYSESLAIFDRPLQDIGIVDDNYIDYYPVNDFTTQGVIQFQVPGNGHDYMDLSSSYLKVTCKIVKKDGSPLPSQKERDVFDEDDDDDEDDVESISSNQQQPAGETESVDEEGSDEDPGTGDEEKRKIAESVAASLLRRANQRRAAAKAAAKPPLHIAAPVNNTLHSIFSRVDVSLQNRMLTESDTPYPYQGYLKALLNTTREMKEGPMQTQLYHKRLAKDAAFNWLFGKEDGDLKTRGLLFDGSNEVDLCGPLYCDIFSISKLIPNGVPLAITLYPSNPEFSLMAPLITPDIKLVITKASYHVRTVEVSAAVLAAQAEVLAMTPAVYMYPKTEVKRFTLPAGLYSTDINDPFTGRVPSELVIGIVSGAASHGNFMKDPFFFDHHNISRVQVTADGADLGQGPIEVKFDDEGAYKSSYLDAYRSLIGSSGNENEAPVGRIEYLDAGHVLYRFVAAPERSNRAGNDSFSEITPLKRTGNVRVSLRFAKALTETMTVIMFATFPGGIKIDKNRAVYEL
jgi:hypothetical protein